MPLVTARRSVARGADRVHRVLAPRVALVVLTASVVLCAVVVPVVPVAPAAAASAPSVGLRPVAALTGLTALASRAGDSTLYVAEQVGVVHAVRAGRVLDAPVLDISSEVRSGGEQGLLGLAFSPDGSKLYVDYTDSAGDTNVDEFVMEGRVAEARTQRTVIEVEQPQGNHNGGQLAFGPDGYLYIGLGDGGAANDEGPGHAPGGNGQSLETLLGKILRIDPTPSADAEYTVPADNPFVGVDDALPEIWSYGLRNPWRFSFDATTGDLWIGDVGQNEVEEIDFAPAVDGRDAGRGENFGWNRLEGDEEFRGDAPDGHVLPVAAHRHDEGWQSITGGYVYRGTGIKALRGVYVYADYAKGDLVGLRPASGGRFEPVDLGIGTSQIAAFGQGSDGALFVLSQSAGLLKIVRGR